MRTTIEVGGGVVESGDYMVWAPKWLVDQDEAAACGSVWSGYPTRRRMLSSADPNTPKRRRLFRSLSKSPPSLPPTSSTIQGMKKFIDLMSNHKITPHAGRTLSHLLTDTGAAVATPAERMCQHATRHNGMVCEGSSTADDQTYNQADDTEYNSGAQCWCETADWQDWNTKCTFAGCFSCNPCRIYGIVDTNAGTLAEPHGGLPSTGNAVCADDQWGRTNDVTSREECEQTSAKSAGGTFGYDLDGLRASDTWSTVESTIYYYNFDAASSDTSDYASGGRCFADPTSHTTSWTSASIIPFSIQLVCRAGSAHPDSDKAHPSPPPVSPPPSVPPPTSPPPSFPPPPPAPFILLSGFTDSATCTTSDTFLFVTSFTTTLGGAVQNTLMPLYAYPSLETPHASGAWPLVHSTRDTAFFVGGAVSAPPGLPSFTATITVEQPSGFLKINDMYTYTYTGDTSELPPTGVSSTWHVIRHDGSTSPLTCPLSSPPSSPPPPPTPPPPPSGPRTCLQHKHTGTSYTFGGFVVNENPSTLFFEGMKEGSNPIALYGFANTHEPDNAFYEFEFKPYYAALITEQPYSMALQKAEGSSDACKVTAFDHPSSRTPDEWQRTTWTGTSNVYFENCVEGDAFHIGSYGNNGKVNPVIEEQRVFVYDASCTYGAPSPPPLAFDHGGQVLNVGGNLVVEVFLKGGLDNPSLPYMNSDTPISIGTTDPSTHESSIEPFSSTFYLCFADQSERGFSTAPSGGDFVLYKHVVIHVQHAPPNPPPDPTPPPPSPFPPPPPLTSGCVCFNDCLETDGDVQMHHISNGICEDGGDGSSYSVCDRGHDCTDCGLRDCDTPPSPPSLPTPPSAPLVCVHGVNMYCVDDESSSYMYDGGATQYAYNNVCQDGGPTPVPGMITDFSSPFFQYGHDCYACGARCCDSSNGCTTADNQVIDCDCYGYTHPRPPSIPPSPPPSPYGCSEFQRRYDSEVQLGRNALGVSATDDEIWDYAFSKQCWQHTTQAECEDAMQQAGYKSTWWTGAAYNTYGAINPTSDGASQWSNAGQFYTCIWDDPQHPGICGPGQSLNGDNHVVVEAATPGFRMPPGLTNPNYVDPSGLNTHCGTGAVHGTVDLAIPANVAGGGGTRVLPSATIYALPSPPYPPSPPHPPGRPPNPPHAPCNSGDDPDLSSLVESCTAVGLVPVSNCANAYDGNKDGYASFSVNGGDAGRSFVVNDAINSQLVLTLTEPHDISHFTFFQRLYDGFDNQVSKISIWLYGEGGVMLSKEQNLHLARAGPPMLQGDTFGASVELSHTVADVKRIEVYITETDDNDDAGFAEISITHKCNSPPPTPPPPPSPSPALPVSPATPPPVPVFQSVFGAVDGTRIAYAWPGTLGSVGLVDTTPSYQPGFTAQECSQFCGSFQSGSRTQFYTGALSTLPHTLFQCTCYASSSWNVVDSTSESGFVHGESTGEESPTLSSAPLPADPVASGFIKVAQGYIARVPVPATTTAFDITVTLRTDSVLTTGNIFRISPWRLNDCRPCLNLSPDGRFNANLMFSEAGWWKFTSAQHVAQPNTEYTIRILLRDRKLQLFVDYGPVIGTESMSEASSGLVLAGEFPHNEKAVFFASKDNNGSPASVFLNMDSIRIRDAVRSHQSMDFEFEANELLKNSIRYHIGFEAPSLAHASQLADYAMSSPSTAVATANGYRGGGVLFDRHAALVLQTSETYLTPEFTICAWTKRTLPLDTLFTTIAGFGKRAVLHYHAYFPDVSFGVGGQKLRASPTSLADPQTNWCHLCASFATGGYAVLYVNGTRVASEPLQGTVSSNLPFAVGASIDPVVYRTTRNDRGFGGIIDDVEGWARQLSDTEVHTVFVGG